jgi:hypothetical protein
MFGRSLQHRCRMVAFRATSWISLALFAATAVGIPLPVFEGTQAGVRFPCQGHRCGCRSLEQCWQKCCCFSRNEQLAWARRNRVSVPGYMLADHNDHHDYDSKMHDGCSTTPPCCAKRHSNGTNDSQGNTWGLVLTSRVQDCHGGTNVWSVVGASLPPPVHVAWTSNLACIDRLTGCSEAPAGLPLEPTTPPPRRA